MERNSTEMYNKGYFMEPLVEDTILYIGFEHLLTGRRLDFRNACKLSLLTALIFLVVMNPRIITNIFYCMKKILNFSGKTAAFLIIGINGQAVWVK